MKAQDGAGEPVTRNKLLDRAATAAAAVGVATFGKVNYLSGKPYDRLVDLSGKTVVITGGNTGLGKETAIALAKFGADVTIACRDQEKARAAVEDITARAGGKAKVRAGSLDLASLDSVRKFADNFRAGIDKLDILVNNAGVMAVPERRLTKDGFEMHMGINHLGHFALTNLLLDKLRKSDDARIVTLSSEAHKIPPGNIQWDDLMSANSYNPWGAYGQSKLANILFAAELQKKVAQQPGHITSVAVHPGACRTELGRYLFDPSQAVNPLLYPLLGVAWYFTKSPEQGAQTSIYCAADPDIKGAGGGRYFLNNHEAAPAAPALVAEDATRLWTVSEELTGVRFAT